MIIKASELFSRKYKDALKAVINHEYTFYTFSGGRSSLKSSFISLVIIILVVMFPFVNVIVFRKVSNTLYDSVYSQLVWAIDKLCLGSKFICTKSPMRIYYKPTGQLILFRGVDNPSRIKSIKLKRGYFAIAWYEESTEFTPEEVRSVNQSVMRGGDRFWIFDSFNPPMSSNNWKNAEVLENKPNRFYLHTTLYDSPVEWIGQPALDEAEWLKKVNKKLFDNEIMGLATGTGLQIFDNVVEKEITDQQIRNFDYRFHGMDWGFYPHPWAFGSYAYDVNKQDLYIYDEMKLWRKGNEQSSIELFKHFIDGQRWRWYALDKPRAPAELPIMINADAAEPKSVSDFRAYGWRMRAPDKDRDYAFKWLQTRAHIYIDRKRCPEAWSEFTKYEHTVDHNGRIIDDYPDAPVQGDDIISTARYALEPVYKKRGM